MKRCGFTLIELLVVIAIIPILAALLFPVFTRRLSRGHLKLDQFAIEGGARWGPYVYHPDKQHPLIRPDAFRLRFARSWFDSETENVLDYSLGDVSS